MFQQLQQPGSRNLASEEYVPDETLEPNSMSYEALQNLGEVVGKVSKGLEEAEISALPVQKYISAKGDEYHDQ